MRTQTLLVSLACMLVGGPYLHAVDQKKAYPKLVRGTSVKGSDIEPFRVTSKQLAAALHNLEKEPSREVVVALRGALRENAILPADYRELLARFQAKGQPERYDVSVGDWGTLHVRVEQPSGIVKDQYSSISGDSPYVNTPVFAARPDDAQARQLLHNFISRQGSKMARYTIITSHFGRHTLIFDVYANDLKPSIRTRYLMDLKTGKIREKSSGSVSLAINMEFARPETEEDYRRLMETFIRLISDHGAAILSRTADIPQYEKQKLDEDIEAAVRAPFKTRDKQYPVVYVCYTYERIGGYVKRYRFPFLMDGRLATPACTTFGRDIGDAHYLE